MTTATPGVIIAGAASALLGALAARRLPTSGGGYGRLAAIAAGALTSPGLLTRLPTRTCRPTVVFTASGRRGLAGGPVMAVPGLGRPARRSLPGPRCIP